jgi:hypothetical protein
MQIQAAFQHRKGRRSSREALIVHVFDRFQLLLRSCRPSRKQLRLSSLTLFGVVASDPGGVCASGRSARSAGAGAGVHGRLQGKGRRP